MRNIGKITNRLTVSMQDFLFGKSLFRFLITITLVFIVILFASCEDVFQVHPYDVRFSGETNINAHHIKEIEQRFRDRQTLRIAIIGDTHCWYSETEDEIADINSKNIDFVIHLGDLTNTGTTKEYEWARSTLDKLQMPYVALIGNHDFLGTGDNCYDAMFGRKDFSFIAARIKFVCLNTNATEYDYISAVPNFDFMEREIVADTALFDRTVILMHAPPFNDQFNNNVVKAFQHYTSFFPGLMFCAYGHNHSQKISTFYDDGVIYYGTDCAKGRNYYIFTLTPNGYEYEIVDF